MYMFQEEFNVALSPPTNSTMIMCKCEIPAEILKHMISFMPFESRFNFSICHKLLYHLVDWKEYALNVYKVSPYLQPFITNWKRFVFFCRNQLNILKKLIEEDIHNKIESEYLPEDYKSFKISVKLPKILKFLAVDQIATITSEEYKKFGPFGKKSVFPMMWKPFFNSDPFLFQLHLLKICISNTHFDEHASGNKSLHKPILFFANNGMHKTTYDKENYEAFGFWINVYDKRHWNEEKKLCSINFLDDSILKFNYLGELESQKVLMGMKNWMKEKGITRNATPASKLYKEYNQEKKRNSKLNQNEKKRKIESSNVKNKRKILEE